MSRNMRKLVFSVSNQVQHRPGCQYWIRLENWNFGFRKKGYLLSMQQNKDIDQLGGVTAKLIFVCKKAGFLMMRLKWYLFEQRHEKSVFWMNKLKQRQRPATGVTMQLISAFVFTTNFKPLAIFIACAAWYMLDLAGRPENRFSQDAAHLMINNLMYLVKRKLALTLCNNNRQINYLTVLTCSQLCKPRSCRLIISWAPAKVFPQT